MPVTALAHTENTNSQASSSQSQTAEHTTETEEKEVKKIEISLGSSYKKVYDGKEISKSDVYSLVSTKSGGVSVFTYEWYDATGQKMSTNPLKAGTYKLKIKVSEKDPSYTGTATVSYIIEQRPLEWDVSSLKISKPYDGTASAAKVKGQLAVTGVVDGDDAVLAYDSVKASDFATAEVQRSSLALTVENASLTGEDAANYSLPKIQPTAEASIIKAYITEITLPDDSNQYRLVVEETVYVTDALADTEFNGEDLIKNALRTKVTEFFEGKENINTAFYTPVLQVLQNDEWIDVPSEDMPQEDIKVVLQYPEGTASDTYEFVMYKMKASGTDAGQIEVWAHTELVEGLETSLVQGETIAIGYVAEKQSNVAMIILIGAVAVMVIAGAVFLKLRKADMEDTETEETQPPVQ